MSIYSGLATREDQRHYNNLLVKLLKTMQHQILEIGQSFIDSKFAKKYHQIIVKMQAFEQHKYLPPKYSIVLEPIMQAIKTSRNRYQSSDLSVKLIEVKEEDEIPSARQTVKDSKEIEKVMGLKNQRVRNLRSQSGISRLKKQINILTNGSVKNDNVYERRSHSMFGDIKKQTPYSWKHTHQNYKNPSNQIPLNEINDIETQKNYHSKDIPLKSRYRRSKVAPIYKQIQKISYKNSTYITNNRIKTEQQQRNTENLNNHQN